MRTRTSVLAAAAVLSSFLLVAGCATPTPTVDTSAPDKEMTFDGLYPVRSSFADAAWARPDADISRYSKVMLQGAGIEYRPGGESGRLYHTRSSADHYALTESQKARFKKVVSEKFREEIAKSRHFKIVDKPGPDVLLIRGGLYDVVSYVPPQTAGRSEVFLSRIGEATLVLEIRDSQSEAIIARAIDRRAAEDVADSFQRSNRATNAAEVRRLVATWARRLVDVLDSYGPAVE